MPTQEWYIHENRFGPFPVGLEFAHEQAHTPYSYAWFCQTCGAVWARRIIRTDAGDITPWFVWNNPCKHCRGDIRTPGSVYLFGDCEYVRNLPYPILTRELLLTTETHDDLLPAT